MGQVALDWQAKTNLNRINFAVSILDWGDA